MVHRTDWGTPPDLFRECRRACAEAGIALTLDAAAAPDNALLPRFYTVADDALSRAWKGESVWLNPPYGRDIWRWTGHAAAQGQYRGATVLALLPVSTDTRWWHRDVFGQALAIWFLQGRLSFVGAASSAPFASALVLWGSAPALPDLRWPAERVKGKGVR